MKTTTTTLPAGPRKRVWVNKHHLPQHGGTSPTAPVWFVEVEQEAGGARYTGYRVCIKGWTWFMYDPDAGEQGPHAMADTDAEVVIYTAAEEAA